MPTLVDSLHSLLLDKTTSLFVSEVMASSFKAFSVQNEHALGMMRWRA